MNKDQKNALFCTTVKIADHLVHAWNYCATLRRLQHFAKQCPSVLDTNEHFMSTIVYAMWDALLLQLAHCSDRRREASGFPKFFKQLRAYLPKDHKLCSKVEEHEKCIDALEPQKKVSNWRHQVLAHDAIKSNFDAFYKINACSLDEVETLISKYNEIIHTYSLPLLAQGFKVDDHVVHANEGVDRFIRGMKKEAEQAVATPADF